MRHLRKYDWLILFVLIEAYIWKLRYAYPRFWILIGAAMLGSLLWHARLTKPPEKNLLAWLLARVGLRPDMTSSNAGRYWHCVAIGSAVNIGMLALIGIASDFVWFIASSTIIITHFQWQGAIRFLLWALAQQLIANGYFSNRVADIVSNPLRAAVFTGLLFSVVHFPNPALMLLLCINGTAGAYLFLRHRNVYGLALAHFCISACAAGWLPAAWIHGMRVGAAY